MIEEARGNVGALIGASAREIIFTGCATESNNTAIHAALKTNSEKRHIITSRVEHSSVIAYCRAMESEGYRVTYLGVERDGLLNFDELESALNDETAVVSLMWVNNEIGVLFPVQKIGELCRERGVLFHCDAVQAVGKMPFDLSKLPIDYVTLAGCTALLEKRAGTYRKLQSHLEKRARALWAGAGANTKQKIKAGSFPSLKRSYNATTSTGFTWLLCL